MNTVAALAVALKLATRPQFRLLQEQTVRNAMHLAVRLSKIGLRVVHGGTNTHMLTIDLKPLTGVGGISLSGDIAARLLDLVGITCNRNTIPGDTSALHPSGIRLGTPWITQRGFKEPEIDRLATVIYNVLTGAKPFGYLGADGKVDARAKISFETLMTARREVAALCDEAGLDYHLPAVGLRMPDKGQSHNFLGTQHATVAAVDIHGEEAGHFLNTATTGDIPALAARQVESARILNPDGSTLADCMIERLEADHYRVYFMDTAQGAAAAVWLEALSDGFVIHDNNDIYGKIPGPVVVHALPEAELGTMTMKMPTAVVKPYFVGARGAHYDAPQGAALPTFTWKEPEGALKRTPLFDIHKDLGAKIVPFAGYEMPVWYTGVSQEHAAVRTAAGLFDVTHMGVWEVSGKGAEEFLNTVTTNDVTALTPGAAHYSYFLGVNGVPLDDLYIYMLDVDRYMLVVNASNNDQDWAWVNALREGTVMIDPARPDARILRDPKTVTLRDLRDPASGADRRVDIALQGPKAQEILLSLEGSEADKKKIKALGWSTVTRAALGGMDMIVSRTGYTGERTAYELFPHPDQAAKLFMALVMAGATPCGLASRDSTRIEAGLPLYGHELGTEREFTPGDAGFGGYVKLWKPFFVGKAAYIAREAERSAVVTRFRMDNKGVRTPQPGTALLDKRGRVVGIVTSCSIDTEGYQCGQAYLKKDAAVEGTALLVLTGGGKASGDGLKIGDKVAIPDAATVLSHFPAKKK